MDTELDDFSKNSSEAQSWGQTVYWTGMARAGQEKELNTLHKEKKNILKWGDVFGQVKLNTQTD